jgi:hypothetical protein
VLDDITEPGCCFGFDDQKRDTPGLIGRFIYVDNGGGVLSTEHMRIHRSATAGSLCHNKKLTHPDFCYLGSCSAS